MPAGDGAFLCRNSWGEDFGLDGNFYISYYDSNIGIHNVVYTVIEDSDNYDWIYQYDEAGWTGNLGYERESAYMANVYQAKNLELLSAVGFYAVDKNTEYQVYVVENFEGTGSMSGRKLVAKGTFRSAGYYTVRFDQEVELEPGERFAVVVHLRTEGADKPIAVEYHQDGEEEEAGEGYISYNGLKWEPVNQNESMNLCLKAYTKNDEKGTR